MKCSFTGKKISAILSVLPEMETSFEDSLKTESISRARRLKKIMGFDKRRRVKSDTNISDMFLYGAKYILENDWIKKEEIGAIVVVTLTQDYLVPQVSEIIHGELGLSSDVVCIDIAQGCAGYVVGLIEGFSLLDCLTGKKLLLFTGDILNRIRDDEEKTEEPHFGGDAATISIIENDDSAGESYFRFYTDGLSGEDLIMPGGAFKHPLYSKTEKKITLDDGRCGDALSIWMDGSDVFNFIQKEVPGLIEEVLKDSGIDEEDIDWYFFHQPNRYILEKLAERCGIAKEKMPMSTTEKYGNSNSSTIPVTIVDAAQKDLQEKMYSCCVSGFGSGLTWAAGVLKIGCMDNCKMIISDL